MDNTEDKKNESPNITGEIYAGGENEQIGYQEAEALPSQTQEESQSQTLEANWNQDSQTEISSQSESGDTGPPPLFVENKFKKILVIFIAFVVLIFIIFLFFRIIFRKKPVKVENITLTYWGLWEDKDIWQPLIDDYQKTQTNVTINYVKQDPKQYRERLQAAIERGEGPDLFRFHNTWVPMLINILSAVPKNIYSDSEFETVFYPVVTSDLKKQENYYGIPLEIDGLLLFYNEDILKSANVNPPTTWVDLQNAVPKLTVKEGNKIITSAVALGTAENIEHFSDILALMMLQNGVDLKRSLFACSDSANTACAVEALTFYHKFAETPNNSWDDTLDNSILAFSQGKVAMIFAPSWQIFSIKSIKPDLNFKTAPIPQLPCDKGPCPSVNWASYWVEGVSSKSKNQQAAWAFLKFLSSEESMKKLYELQTKARQLFGEPYSRVELLKTLSSNLYLAPLVSGAPTMKSFYLASRTYDGETGLNSTLIRYLKDAVNSLSQGVSPESALRTADEGFKQVYSRFGISTQ